MATAAKKAAARRIYKLKMDHGGERFIRASTGMQALAYATKGQITVKVADQEDLLGLPREAIEEAVETPEPAAAASA